MTRLTDGNKTITIKMVKWNGTEFDPDYSNDFFEVGTLDYDELTDSYAVDDVDYCIDEAIEELKKMMTYYAEWFLFVDGEEVNLHEKYQLVIDTEDTTYGIEYDDFDDAKVRMLDIYESWIVEERSKWAWSKEDGENYKLCPTEEQIESWDMMIENCTCWIAKWKPDEHTYYDEKMNYYFMSDKDAYNINWLPWDELKKKYNW